MSINTHLSHSSIDANAAPGGLRPLGFASSLLYFGIPAAVTFASFHALLPALVHLGLDELTSFFLALGLPLFLLLCAALVAYRCVEKRPFTRAAFAERMRYPQIRWRDALWAFIIFMGGGIGMGLFSGLMLTLIHQGWAPLPAHLPTLADPRISVTPAVLAQSAGGVIHGRWDIALLYLLVFVFNMLGEEFWWRGIILTRQEKAFGRWTWLVHGTLWACFHVFKWWDILPLLPTCLLVSFAAQRTRSNWPALLGHILVNGLSLGLVLWYIVG
jgi:membrane protease YdiL (CAAX protease family)